MIQIYRFEKEGEMNKRYFGITYKDYEKAEENGISKGTVDNRVYQLAWDIDTAITKPIRTKENVIAPYLSIAEENGVKENTVRRRIERGWSIEEAVNTPTYSNKEKLKKARSNKKIVPIKKKVKSKENYFRKLNQMDFERMKGNVL